MYQYPYNWSHCATCDYWLGKRELCDIFGSRLEVESPMDQGKCANRQSGCWQQIKQANGCCSQYKRWGALKR